MPHRASTSVLTFAMATPLVAPFAFSDTVFHTWIEAPSEVMVGDTFTISVWSSVEGSLLGEGQVAPAGFSLDLLATGYSATFTTASIPRLFPLSVGVPELNALRDVRGLQLWFNSDLIYDNPILLFTTEVILSGAAPGLLELNVEPRVGNSWIMAWYSDLPNSNDITDDDPGSTRIITPATIRVIPAPGVFVLFSLAICTSLRRRR